ncbi:MAG: sulfatase-like hydrolase/transferase [Fuerstiella sp.]|nr:sulfatase-like hydrolase/transferase [Fuerstiella sp.]
MNINRRILATALTAFLHTCLTQAAPPNIILILTDDQGWSQMSASMDPGIPEAQSAYLETPNMARLMQQGLRFTNGYSPAPLCTPTRRCILCGTSAARSGPEFKSSWVPKDHTTIPKALKAVEADYRCAHFGKWGEQMISTPEECGYDASDGMTGNNTGGMPKSLGIESGSHDEGRPHFINNIDPKLTKSITTRAIDFMQQQHEDEKPFYVQVSYYAQHLSVVTREKTLEKYKAKGIPDRGYTKAWAAMMEELDDGIGRLIDAVDKSSARDNTWIFFTADNGGRGTVPGGDTSRPATNTPLTGAKHSLYEGGVRVPFVVRGPGVEPGSVCRVPVVGYDFLPTFHDLAGGQSAETYDEVDGVSLKSLLQNPQADSPPRKAGAVIFHRPNRLFSAARSQTHKLMVHWKRDGSVSRRELFNLTKTPTEEGHDIAATQAATADQLQQQLVQFLKLVDADKPPAKSPRKRKKKQELNSATESK